MHFDDIKVVEKLDTRVNFIIKCEDEAQLNHLKKLMETNKRGCNFEEFINKYRENIS